MLDLREHRRSNVLAVRFPFVRTAEFLFRFGCRARRFCGLWQGDDRPEILVSRKMGLICVAIPLCGTLTLKRFFRSNPNVEFEAETLRDTVPNVLKSKPCGDTPLLFTVVRDPWSRVVCCYEKKIRGAYAKRSYYDGYAGLSRIASYDGLSANMSFDAFVEWLCSDEGRDDLADRHWMSQHRFLHSSKIEWESIKLLRLESIERDLNSALTHLNLPYQILQKNNSSAAKPLGRLHATTKEYYTKRTVSAIGDRYAIDIEVFGYVF